MSMATLWTSFVPTNHPQSPQAHRSRSSQIRRCHPARQEIAATACRHCRHLEPVSVVLEKACCLSLLSGPQAKTRVHPTKLAGAGVQDKLKLLRDDLTGTAPGAPGTQ